MDKMPVVLYHYTTVDALASILEGKKFRFFPLTKLDDMQEEKVQDNKKLGKFVFVSSWTDNAEESIPMWNMYSSLDRGVRIQLPALPFKEYPLTEDELLKSVPADRLNHTGDPGFTPIFPANELVGNSYIKVPYIKNEIIHKINYTNEIDKIVPRIIYTENGGTQIKLGKLGKDKAKCWSFQNEWRYILNIYPGKYLDPISIGKDAVKIMLNEMFNNIFEFPFNYYELAIDDEAYKKMKIIMSPNISKGNKIIVELLKEKYNPKMKVDESILKGNIR